MLMGLASGVIGCLVFLQKRSLVGEALSHASYPGAVFGLILAGSIFQGGLFFGVLVGAFFMGLLALFSIDRIEKRLNISADAALCLVLSLFFGVGITVASGLQITHALWFRHIQVFLFGQAATMYDAHIVLYGAVALSIISVVVLLYRQLEIFHFDSNFAKVVGMREKGIRGITYILLALAIVVGMRSVGVVLMSAMLIAPAAAARQWTKKLSSFFAVSGFLGMCTGFLGIALSVWIPIWAKDPHLALPTGPMIVLSGTAICLFSLFFAPESGFFSRLMRVTRFRLRCEQENILKALYKNRPIKSHFYLLWRMRMKGWIEAEKLSKSGHKVAENLIRLHRLWEVYLVHMGQEADRVHHSAEEMEHILTPEIERELANLLDDPAQDPHDQPIPGAIGALDESV